MFLRFLHALCHQACSMRSKLAAAAVPQSLLLSWILQLYLLFTFDLIVLAGVDVCCFPYATVGAIGVGLLAVDDWCVRFHPVHAERYPQVS